MAASKPLKYATVMARLTVAERRNLDKLCRENDITLSQALRQGARIYLEELDALRTHRRARLKAL